MSEWLAKFSSADGWDDIATAACELSVSSNHEDIPALLRALSDQIEARRLGAVIALSGSRDGRMTMPLIQVLRNTHESPSIRGQAAEILGKSKKRKAVEPLIECSTDDSVEVRFWCVFALGSYLSPAHKPPLRVVRALESRLADVGTLPDYWTVGLEALAMLAPLGRRHPAGAQFRETLIRVLQDPLGNANLWQWATFYENLSSPREPDASRLLDLAIQTIHSAGFDPASYGRRDLRSSSPLNRL